MGTLFHRVIYGRAEMYAAVNNIILSGGRTNEKTICSNEKIMAGVGLAAVILIVSATGVKAMENVDVNAKNFPDKIFREYICDYVDTDQNGILDETEIAKTTKMDVSYKDIKDLKGIQYFTNLEVLYCEGNELTRLNVSKNTKLTRLDCDDNQLTKLDVSKNTELESLSCSYNQLTKLDVSKNTELESLSCASNQLTKLDLGKNKELGHVFCDSKVKITGYNGYVSHL